jgi:ABC-type sugar transport system permease subunit
MSAAPSAARRASPPDTRMLSHHSTLAYGSDTTSRTAPVHPAGLLALYATGAALVLAAAWLGALRVAHQQAGARQLAAARAAATSSDAAKTRTLDPGAPSLLFRAVVSEPAPSKYVFLRKRLWLEHPDATRVGRTVDDKSLHDLVGDARRTGESVRHEPDGSLLIARPTDRATALARIAAVPAAAHLPLGLVSAALAAGAALTLLGRRRTALQLTGLGACAGLVALAAPAGARVAPLVGALPGLALVLLRARGALARLRGHGFAYAYVLPAAVGMTLLVLIPFALGCVLGFFDHARGVYTFVGVANFREILRSPEFYATLGVTALWTVLNVLLHVSLGLALALLLKEPWIRLRGLFRVLLIVPWAVPNYITALMWKGMFHQQYGAINTLLAACGLGRVSWFSSFLPAFTANVVTNTWLGFPFMMVVCLGALQSIPRDVYEAAAVDGASPSAQFFRITLPLLRPALFPAVIIGSIWTFNQFNIIYLVSEGRPGGKTDILITEAYRWAFERGERYGLAAAYGTLIFLILLGFCLFASRRSRATQGAYE